MNKSLKVLQICSKPPFPPKDGGALAMNVMTRAFSYFGVDLFVLTAYSYKHPLKKFPLEIPYQAVFLDLKPKIFDAFFNLFSHKSYILQRFYSREYENALIQILKENTFDVIQIESLFASPYINTIRKYSKAKVLIRTHNVEYLIWDNLAKSTFFLKKYYFKILSKRLKAEEIKALNAVDELLSISQQDTNRFKKMGIQTPISYVPFGLIEIPHDKVFSADDLFFIGAMDWRPNCEALNFFLNQVWQNVINNYPHLKLVLGGKKMLEFTKNIDFKNIEIVGEVENSTEFIQAHGILIAPILSGSGVKVKILEAMSMRKTVITTNKGIQGLKVEPGKDILIANTPQEFVQQIGVALKNKEEIGENAYQYVKKHHDGLQIVKNLIVKYKSISDE